MRTRTDSKWDIMWKRVKHLFKKTTGEFYQKIKKLQQRQLASFTATKPTTNTTYQIQNKKYPSLVETVHRNKLVENHTTGEPLPAIIEEYVPPDQGHDHFLSDF